MIVKIVWLSLLSLALEAGASSEHSKSLKDQEFTDQQYRHSRTIWPFTNSDSNSDETSVNVPPPEAGANLFFDEETDLPQSPDLSEYPVWRTDNYRGASSEYSASLKDQEFPDQQYRYSRSIWPFTNSDSNSDETPATTPPPEAEANVYLNGETALPQAVDLTMYPVWKIHRYNGFDLKPINLQSNNVYQLNGVLNPSRYDSPRQNQQVQTSYQTGYENFVNSKNSQVDAANQQGPYSPVNLVNSDTIINKETPSVYPPVQTSYPEEVPTYHSGESQSSEYWNSNNGQNVQNQHTVDNRPAENYGPPQVPHATYGVPVTGGQTFQGETASLPRVSSSDNTDLSFLDNLGGLAPLLPEPQDTTEAPAPGLLANLFPWMRGTSEAPITIETPTEPSRTGGLLSYIFGQRQQTEQSQTSESASSSSSIGSALSSMFYRKEAEKPAVVSPPTIYLPETRGSYMIIKVPGKPETGLPKFGTHVSNIPIQDVPPIPFRPDEIPPVFTPTLNTDYNYNLGQSVERNNNKHQIHAATDSQDQSNYQHFVPSLLETAHPVEIDAISGNQQTKYQQDNTNFAKDQVQSVKEYQVPSIQKIVVPFTVVPSKGNIAQTGIGQHFESNDAEIGSSVTNDQDQGSTYGHVPSAAYQLHIGNKNDHQTAFNDQRYNQNTKYVIKNQGSNQFSNKPLTHVNSDSTVVINNHRFNDQVYNQQSAVKSESTAQVNTQGLREQTELLNYQQQLPIEEKPFGPVNPTYQVPISAYQSPRNPPQPTVHYDNLPVHEAIDFQKSSFHQETNNQATSANQDLSSLTSYGTPTISYQAGSFLASPSDVSEVIVEATNNIRAANDSLPFEQQDQHKVTLSDDDDHEKVDAKVNEESSSLNRNLRDKQVWRRSEPERQAPTDKQESLIFRSVTDLIPDAREGRHFDEAKVILGYSKVHQNSAAIQ